jgi:phosphatidylserine/phosphatidylglycerophosphate/cardiolipin synthase-like enzyme
VGSANLSKAAFQDNYEANALMPITKAEFEQLRTWLSRVQSVPITKDWIQHKYTEAPLAKLKKSGAPNQVSAHFSFKFKPGINYGRLIQARRQRQVAFEKVEQSVRRKIADCAHGKLSNKHFWKWFWTAWQSWRFQGKGLEMTCKGALWREACQALNAILKAPVTTRERSTVLSRPIGKQAH